MAGTDRDARRPEVERYETILGTIDDVVFVVDAEWSVEYANERALAHAETTREELHGTPVMSLAERMAVDEGADRFEAALERVFDDEGPFPITVELELDLPGEKMYAEYRLTPIRDDGSVTEAVVVARDVTERKHREQRLRSVTEEYEAIFEHTEDPVFLIDVDTAGAETEFRVERLNPAYETVTGLTEQQARGKTPRELLGDELGAEIESNYRRCVEAREPITYEEELPMPERRVVAQTNLAPVIVGGEVTRIVGVARDITERVAQEERLRKRDRQLSRLHRATRELLGADSPEQVAETASEAADDILDFSLNGIHFYDDGGLAPVAVSEGSRELLGAVPVIDDGIAWEAYQQGEARIYDDVREAEQVLNPETPIRSEMVLPLSDRGVFIVSSQEAAAFDDSEVELARTLAANTEAALERIEREQRLRTREAALEHKNERLNEFASVVSHDLRNPLNVASGRLELVRAECDNEHLDAVASAHDRMDGLIDDLLRLARQGESVEEREPVDLAEAVNSCWRTVPTDDATHAVETDLTLNADRSRLRQLLENLFRNAVEHGGREVTVGELADGFYVADDGPGIPESERESVFEVGYSTGDGGNGFGLNIVKRIADAHGWEVEITDSEADGARFEVTGVDRVA